MTVNGIEGPNPGGNDAAGSDVQAQQIAELRAAVELLSNTVQAAQARAAQTTAFNEALAEIRQLARVASSVPSLPPQVFMNGSEARDCEGPCACLSAECCLFEIVLRQIRATRPQIELVDIGDVPFIQNALEIRLYVTADGIGFMMPSFSSTLDLRADGFPPGPGPWVYVDRVINRIPVKKGTTRSVALHIEIEEDDTRVTEALAWAGKNEFGEADGVINLNCCLSEVYPPMPLDVDLRYGGEGLGAVQAIVFGRRVCC